MSNSSSITEFLLLAFAEKRELQLLHFWLFLGIYLAALLGNGLIITAIACDHHLHTPMYFFLLNLSLLDLGSISTTVPKAIANSLWDNRAISLLGFSGWRAMQLQVVEGSGEASTATRNLPPVERRRTCSIAGLPCCTVRGTGHGGCLLPGMAAGVCSCGCSQGCPGLSLRAGSLQPRGCSERMSNSSSITEFLLLAFADRRELQLLHFWLFLGIYLAALLGNGLIITAIACDHHLHTPMYFFLLNLSVLDLGSISTTLPKAMTNSLWDNRDISYMGCAAQVFFFFFFMSAEYFLLTVMAYDRYVAICKPLHYGTLLGSRACVHMAAGAWGSGFLYALLHNGTFAYLKPPSISSPSLDLVISFLYSVVPPAMKPLMYSMRNQELKETLKKLIQSDVSRHH
ncbi:unnamed protein product [Bubo scandiacus]